VKTCFTCGLEKEDSLFHKDRYRKNGLCYRCKDCTKIHRKRTKPGKPLSTEQGRKKSLKKRFNMTLEQYDSMSRQQEDVCAVCGGVNKDGRRLCVDHSHKTGKVRGLLCTVCNWRLGIIEDEGMMQSLCSYLKRYN
jgi:hypothetical protein